MISDSELKSLTANIWKSSIRPLILSQLASRQLVPPTSPIITSIFHEVLVLILIASRAVELDVIEEVVLVADAFTTSKNTEPYRRSGYGLIGEIQDIVCH